MNTQPNEILKHIFRYLFGKDQINVLRVCTRWNRIMNNILSENVPSFEDCIIDSDYGHFRHYFDIALAHEQMILIRMVNNKYFNNYFKLEHQTMYVSKLYELFSSYSKKGSVKVIKYLSDKFINRNEYENLLVSAPNYEVYVRIIFIVSASEGHIELVKFAIEKGADINAEDSQALIKASENGRTDVVKLLIDKGAKIKPLAYKFSAEKGHFEIVKLLVENNSSKIYHPYTFRKGVEFGHLNIVEFFIEKGVDIHSGNEVALRIGIEKNHYQVVELLIKKGADFHVNNNWALRLSVDKERIEIAQLLVYYKADISVLSEDSQRKLKLINEQPDEILKHIFSYLTGIDIIRALQVCKRWNNLIENKILIKNPIPSLEDCVLDSDYYHFRNYLSITLADYQKQFIKLVNNKVFANHFEIGDFKVQLNNLLSEYSERGLLKVVKYLIEKGADIHDGNNAALRCSAYNGHLETVQFLVEKGADIHDNYDEALRWSAYKGYLEVVKFLVEKGADIHVDNDYALYWSATNGHIEVIKFLVEKGANVDIFSKKLQKKLQKRLKLITH